MILGRGSYEALLEEIPKYDLPSVILAMRDFCDLNQNRIIEHDKNKILLRT